MVDLDTRLLPAFVTVAEELNFTQAAERLVLAQQALSGNTSTSSGAWASRRRRAGFPDRMPRRWTSQPLSPR